MLLLPATGSRAKSAGKCFSALSTGNGVRLPSAHRADAARRALAAGFESTELHRESRLFVHIHGIVENHHATVPEQRTDRAEGLVIERRIPLRLRQIGTQGTTDLDRARRSPAQRPAAKIIEHLAQRQPECELDHTAAAHVPNCTNS